MIDPEAVEEAIKDCLFLEHEVAEPGVPPEGAVLVEGITGKYGFHPERLEEKREQVQAWLDELPDAFKATAGGGWSFLNMCNTRNDEQWTGLHQRMEQLMCLAMGLGLMTYCLPREMWSALPGGMPYVMIIDPDKTPV